MRSALVISEHDNVATALEALDAGRQISIGDRVLVVHQLIPAGHKVALDKIPMGQPVVKYGSPIGLATTDIAAGTHVHTHNVESSRGRGDLAAGPAQPEPRLAEPADEAGTGESGSAPVGASAARASLTS